MYDSQRIAVAMSGGLDSSVAAHLLASRGESIIGLSMLLWDRLRKPSRSGGGRCCGSLDLGDARRVAQQLGIPHYTLRMDEEFGRQVVSPFVADYLAGRTPSPCIRCNTFIKFDLLVQRARSFGAGRVATGHYARILRGDDGLELHAGRDRAKDQSYFLFELRQEQLASALFPLGETEKSEVRGLARAAGLLVADKGESMDVCFVTDGVGGFVEEQAAARPEAFRGLPSAAAEVVRRSGESLGRGGPYYGYTVGQRRGLGVAVGERLYVLDVDADRNRVVVGSGDELLCRGLQAERAHWIGPPPGGDVEATVRIRSRHRGVAARIHGRGNAVEVEFAERQRGVTPGQAAVFYRGTRVLGGCWIRQALS